MIKLMTVKLNKLIHVSIIAMNIWEMEIDQLSQI